MANAKNCDRCSKFYLKNSYPSKDQYGNECNMAKIKVNGDNGGVIDELDLCDECMDKFISFMKEGKKGDDNAVSEV